MPTAFRLITGRQEKPDLDAREPMPADGMPAKPDYLIGAAAAKWDELAPELHRIGLLTAVDGDALGAYCAAWARYVQAERDLEKISALDPNTHGVLVRTAAGTPILNPMMGVTNTLRRDMMRLAAELGLTPAGRTQIKVDARPNEAAAEKKYRS